MEIKGATAPAIAPIAPNTKCPPQALNKNTPQKIQAAITPGNTLLPKSKKANIFAPMGKYKYEPCVTSKLDGRVIINAATYTIIKAMLFSIKCFLKKSMFTG
jgi:hypothetical protein